MLDNSFVLESYNDCSSLRDVKVEIPETVVHIKEKAFMNHPKMKKITIHSKLKKIGKSAFESCEYLQRVKFLGESELVVIPEKCFKDCTSLKEFKIPSEVGVIKKYAFSGCTSIKHIVIPEYVIAIEAGAFDKWTKDQTIEIYSNFKFGIVCKATIINHSLDDKEILEDEIYETEAGQYLYAVNAKCGHVGRHRYMPITFPVCAETRKEAAKVVRSFPRVKHDHKNAILSVRQISLSEYNELIDINNNDPYLSMKSKYQQKEIEDLINQRAVLETNIERNK
jgi:hypothetical protein